MFESNLPYIKVSQSLKQDMKLIHYSEIWKSNMLLPHHLQPSIDCLTYCTHRMGTKYRLRLAIVDVSVIQFIVGLVLAKIAKNG